MPWVKLDDGFADHPKIAGLTDAAFRAHVEALCYAGRHTTDGHVPATVVRRIATTRVVRELEAADLWHPNGSGVELHDYLDHNPSKAQLEAERSQKVAAGKAGAAAKYGRRDRRVGG